MKTHNKLFFAIFLVGMCSCIPKSFPIFVPKSNKYGFKDAIIKSDNFDVFLEVSAETTISDTNYIIPVDIVISNHMNDALHIKTKDIKAYLTANKDEVFEGVAERGVDTIIAKRNIERMIPFIIEFKTFNRSCIRYFTDINSLEIIISDLIINDSILFNKNVFFLCK